MFDKIYATYSPKGQKGTNFLIKFLPNFFLIFLNEFYFLHVRKPVFNEQQFLKVHLFFTETHQVPGNDREGQIFDFKSYSIFSFFLFHLQRFYIQVTELF
jgi:hypothetical protein